MSGLLSWLTFIPIIGMVLIILVPRDKHQLIKIIAAVATGISLILSVVLFLQFDRTTSELQFVERAVWIGSYNINFFIGVDGLSITLIILTALLGFLCIFASWGINKAVKGYFALFLLLETGMLGVFVALDFFLFYVFWEVMLLPMYFLIGIWGGPRREYAAIKFFLYTLLGSVLMLLGILALYFYGGSHTFDMTVLMEQGGYARTFQMWVWAALFIGFAIKVPVFPFHTWLPDAHVEAPTAISVILAGVLLKMGGYGILRVCFSIFPEATRSYAIPLAILGIINIVYGALCAMAQKDVKKLVAYSSVSHMGYVLLGSAALSIAGLTGGVLQMFNHGTTTAMLFLLVGVIYDRAHHRDIDGFGGLATIMPVYAGIFSLAFFASLGLPGLSSFISEALVFLGTFPVYRWAAIIAAIGIVLTAGYILWTLQRMFLGKPNEKYLNLPDMTGRELFTLVPLGIIVIILGVYPKPILDLMQVTINHLAGIVQP
ncbi:MAG: NADH-quinone oxidoreductase subunit M [Candidatus Eisenbacteria bacterium]|uniref:NADH-quinone oxidoreductase subunit M n=1 Tax=Eiseniibacteriota bacterium TaxID=2212470 RepID=A0A948RTS5_UNCEI|nr:NADH-quinone oxidoreductase subunit M [Candidatus Eisenbacteria bacterium]MBU1949423.1 NADH-quinone oxidoreductase subunit M [Candidatus Eisenbacteria bacterium]MBU2689579.1 NADH-quinone oxidoreductase subunit M [Candidatus Eisenbacteria bacterium]